jgi:hypothetical protein
MKATKRDKIALAVGIMLLVLAFVYAFKTLPSGEGKLDGQGNSTGQQSDAKTSTHWPMDPPKMQVVSDWGEWQDSDFTLGRFTFRYIKVNG